MIHAPLYTLEQTKKCDCPIKWVRVNGILRFTNGSYNHSQMVDDGEKATAAGTFSIFDDYIRITDTFSTTLRIGSGPEDEEELGRLYNLPVKSVFDM